MEYCWTEYKRVQIPKDGAQQDSMKRRHNTTILMGRKIKQFTN
jgi:hypothetical protein